MPGAGLARKPPRCVRGGGALRRGAERRHRPRERAVAAGPGRRVARLEERDRGEFSHEIHGKPGALVRAFWKKVAASGRDSPPPVRRTDEEVLAFVRATRGAIGYVSAAAPTSGVKVIRVGG